MLKSKAVVPKSVRVEYETKYNFVVNGKEYWMSIVRTNGVLTMVKVSDGDDLVYLGDGELVKTIADILTEEVAKPV